MPAGQFALARLPGRPGRLMPGMTSGGTLPEGLHLLSLVTPETNLRNEARLLVRQALRETLNELLASGDPPVLLISQPGQPIRLAPPWSAIGISISHESGRSLAAINQNGPVGIDLMRVSSAPADCHAVSRDYLGPQAAATLAHLPAEQRRHAFARAWTRHEARAKCLALDLSEWTPERNEQLRNCTVVDLDMPNGWVAAVAIANAAVHPVI